MDSVDTAAPTPETLPNLASMIRARPDIRAALLAGAAAKTDAIYFRRYAIPDPTFGIAYAHDFYTLAGNQAHMLTASVALPLALFDHGQHLAPLRRGQTAELGFQADRSEARAGTARRCRSGTSFATSSKP
jgi:cobalt-zinc-cadmium efflux system outer membrane protein